MSSFAVRGAKRDRGFEGVFFKFIGRNHADPEQEHIGLGGTGGEPSAVCRAGPAAECIVHRPPRLRRGQHCFFCGGWGLQRRWGARRRGGQLWLQRRLTAFGQRGCELPGGAELWRGQLSFFRGSGGLQRRWGARPRGGQHWLQRRLGAFGQRGRGLPGRAELWRGEESFFRGGGGLQ